MQNPDRIFEIPVGKCKIPIRFLESRSGNAKSRSDFWNPDREMQNPNWCLSPDLHKSAPRDRKRVAARQQLEVVADYFV
jgi:hypothetical protein